MGVLGLIGLSKLVFTLNKVTRLTMLGNTPSKGVVVIFTLYGEVLISVALLRSQASHRVIMVVVTERALLATDLKVSFVTLTITQLNMLIGAGVV